jgi:hypothetical protein
VYIFCKFDEFTRSTPIVLENLQEACQKCFVIDQQETALD